MKPGIYTMGMAEYLAIDALSSGVAHTLLSASPLHAKHDKDHPSDATKEMDLGSYAHAMLLEGSANFVEVDADSWRTKAAQEARDDARSVGKLPILTSKVQEVSDMVAAAHSYVDNSEIAGAFRDGAPEQTLIWSEDSVLCKARPDWLSPRHLIHYKTTTNVNVRAFGRVAASMGYAMAMMFYQRGLNAVLPDNECEHFILAQEATAPFACKLFDITAALSDVAERQVERAIGIWARCLASGQWPAYDGSVHSIDLQPWELAQAEEDMLTDDELSAGAPA